MTAPTTLPTFLPHCSHLEFYQEEHKYASSHEHMLECSPIPMAQTVFYWNQSPIIYTNPVARYELLLVGWQRDENFCIYHTKIVFVSIPFQPFVLYQGRQDALLFLYALQITIIVPARGYYLVQLISSLAIYNILD